MAELVGGAALGVALDQLLKSVLNVAQTANNFKPILESLSETLKVIQPMFEEIKRSNAVLDRPRHETTMLTRRLEEAVELIGKCSKVKRWKFWSKYFHAKKLMKVEESLRKFFQIDLQAQLAMDSRKILVVLDHLSSSSGIGDRVFDQSFSLRPCGVPQVPDFVIGLDVPLRQLKQLLLKEDTSVVVLSAPGGCGKTTLAKMLCHDDEIQAIFGENISFVTVSNKPNLMVIVQNLFQHLGGMVPEFQNDEDAIIQLENFLKQKTAGAPMLLVLDDVWSGSESLVEKFQLRIPGYKILVTSRDVFPSFDLTYNLELLNDQDAMALFHHSAFPQGWKSTVSHNLVEKIVRGCKGFPLALTVVGRSLRGKAEMIWIHMLKQWSEGQSIFDSNINLLLCLKTSLDALDDGTRMKECFLDLGSFPEDQKIAATALVDMWVELYGFDEEGIDALANIYELSTRNLVNLVLIRKDGSEIDGYYNEHFVMQHDLLRELAVHQSSQEPVRKRRRLFMDIKGNDPPKWLIGEMQQPFGARLLSISTDETFSSSWYNMQLPEIEVLILNIRTRNYNLPQFMEKMNQLKILIIVNYSFCPAELINFSRIGCMSSLKRIRLEHISISSLSESTIQLRNLRKMSLIMCEIGNAFKNSTMEIPCMFPNLVEIDIDCCNDLVELPEGFCNIVKLKKLSITNCVELDNLPEGFGKLTNLETLSFRNCTKLTGLPESIRSLHKLRLLDISDCLSLRKLPTRMDGLCGLEKLRMRGCEKLHKLPPSVKDLKKLKDVICDEEAAYLWEPFMIHLTGLIITVLKEDANLNWLDGFHH